LIIGLFSSIVGVGERGNSACKGWLLLGYIHEMGLYINPSLTEVNRAHYSLQYK